MSQESKPQESKPQIQLRIMKHIAAQETGYIMLVSDLIREFGVTIDEALAHITLALKADFLVARFKLFDQPWCQNLLEIPAVVETPEGPYRITPKDVVVGFERTAVL